MDDLPFDPATRHTRKQFPGVPDGIYDVAKYEVRYKIVSGFVMKVVSKIWIDKGTGFEDNESALGLAWGTYSDIPKPNEK